MLKLNLLVYLGGKSWHVLMTNPECFCSCMCLATCLFVKMCVLHPITKLFKEAEWGMEVQKIHMATQVT